MTKTKIINSNNLQALKNRLENEMEQSHRYIRITEKETCKDHAATGKDFNVRTDIDEKITLEKRYLDALRIALCYIDQYSSEIEI